MVECLIDFKKIGVECKVLEVLVQGNRLHGSGTQVHFRIEIICRCSGSCSLREMRSKGMRN